MLEFDRSDEPSQHERNVLLNEVSTIRGVSWRLILNSPGNEPARLLR